MIIQGLLDLIVITIAGVLTVIPPLPPDFYTAVTMFKDIGVTVAEGVSKFGPIVPWGTVSMVLGWWVSAVGFWMLMLVVRLLLWAFGR